MMIKAAYFPTVVYAKDVNLDNRLFEKEVIDWSNKDKGVTRTNLKGWHSQTNMQEIPVFKPLVDELYKMMGEIFVEEWLDREPMMGNMWANINPPGGMNRPHLHPNSHFSGVYYIKLHRILVNLFLMNQDQEHTWLCLQENKANLHHIYGEKFI